MSSQAQTPLKGTLVLDARLLHSGLGRYATDLMEGCGRRGAGLPLAVISRSSDAERVAPNCDSVLTCNARPYSIAEQWRVASLARGLALHVPHYNAPIRHRGPLIITIHDLIHVLHPHHRRRRIASRLAHRLMTLAAARADWVITVSNYTRRAILTHLATTPSKVRVIYRAPAAHFRPSAKDGASAIVRRAFGLERPYLLYVGNLKPHKGVETLLNAAAQLFARNRDHDLVIVGDDRRNGHKVRDLAALLGIADRAKFVPFADDALLPSLYSGSSLFVMPSTMEGFGLPVVEAMACGAPVVSSRGGALPEITQDAAELFDPGDAPGLLKAITRVLESPARAEELSGRGLARAREFSLEKAVQEHLEIYSKVGVNPRGCHA